MQVPILVYMTFVCITHDPAAATTVVIMTCIGLESFSGSARRARSRRKAALNQLAVWDFLFSYIISDEFAIFPIAKFVREFRDAT